MRLSKTADILLNVYMPVLLGYLIYLMRDEGMVKGVIKNQLPDGLWAYSLMSGILIIWARRINIYWCIIVALFSTFYELLQFFNVVPGTGDIWDILTYFISFVIVLSTNKYFIHSNIQSVVHDKT